MYRSECPRCGNQDIKVYVLYRDLPIQASEIQEAIRILNDLTLVANLNNRRDRTGKAHNFHFEPNHRPSAFSLVFLSAGSCTLIRDIALFYFVCDKNITSGVNLPRTFAPANDSERVNVSCGANTLNQGNGVCSSEGIWVTTSPCMCKKGYTLNIEQGCIGKLTGMHFPIRFVLRKHGTYNL